jgi:hypothetical protein
VDEPPNDLKPVVLTSSLGLVEEYAADLIEELDEPFRVNLDSLFSELSRAR